MKRVPVLNVEFRDTDKTLVLPITQMISKAYQAYSNRGRDRDLANVISYLRLKYQEQNLKLSSIVAKRLSMDMSMA